MKAAAAFTLPVGNKGKEETTGVINTEFLKRDINCKMQVSNEKYAFPVKVKMRSLKGLVQSRTQQDSASILALSCSDPWTYRQISQNRQIQMSQYLAQYFYMYI